MIYRSFYPIPASPHFVLIEIPFRLRKIDCSLWCGSFCWLVSCVNIFRRLNSSLTFKKFLLFSIVFVIYRLLISKNVGFNFKNLNFDSGSKFFIRVASLRYDILSIDRCNFCFFANPARYNCRVKRRVLLIIALSYFLNSCILLW